MNTFAVNPANGSAVLTGYTHDLSDEMPNARIRPAVLIFPGGGYRICSDREAEPVALAYLAEGYNAFVLRYSVGPEEPLLKSFSDANAAVLYLHKHAEELNIDKNKIVLAGFSAGGHLAAWVSVCGKQKPAAVILGYPVITAEAKRKTGKDFPEICGRVDGETPPTFIFSTRNDPVVPITHSLQYAAALEKANVAFELHIFGDGEHALSLAKTFTSAGKAKLVNADAALWFPLSVNWLKRLLGDFEAG